MAQEWPELNLKGSLSKQAPDFGAALSPGQQSYSVALVLTVPVFSGGSIFSTNIERRSLQQIAELRTQKDIFHFKSELENERSQILSLQSSLSAQTLNLAQNEEIVKLSFKSYQLGKATIVELLGSQNDLIDSKINLAKTKLDLSTQMRQFSWNLGVTE